MEDSRGRIWSGGDYGLFCFDDGIQCNYVPPSFAKSNFEWVISLAEDSDGAIWAGTKLGFLHRYHEGQFETVWESEKGSEYPVCALHFDSSGALWMARYGIGLTRFKNGEFSHFTPSEGLPTSTINGILDDPRGFLWMTSKEGVYRVSHESFEQFAQGNLSDVFWQRFTEKHGLPSNECNGEQNQPSLCQTEDGRIWVPTLKGVGFIDPAVIEEQGRAPRLVIQDVTLYGGGNHVETLVSDGEYSSRSGTNPLSITIPPGNNNLLIRYTAVDFTEPKQVRFKYRIRGLDDNWVDAQNERAALIASLGSGTYRFELMAENHLGVASDLARLEFVVLPYWWETSIFRFLLATVLLAGGLSWYSTRVKQLQRRNELQADFSRQLIEREESERKRISRELHDSLGHELLLVRNRALDGANRADSIGEQQQFEDISEMAGKALENARGMAYNLRPFELDRIGFKKAVETMVSKISESSETRYFKDIDELDDVVSSETLVYLYRLLQEGLNNILKHSDASVVMIEIKKDENHVRVQLDDNGLGFDMSIPRTGLGLRGMEERVKLIGGTFRLTSAPGAGTQIRIQIPF
jgi:signal transduction histidine kinase